MMKVVCPLGACKEGELCPHAMQVALVTDYVGAQMGSGRAIALADVIAAHEATRVAISGGPQI